MKIKPLLKTLFISATAAFAVSVYAETNVRWENLGDREGKDGWHFIERITVTGDTDMKGLAFNRFARKMKMLNPLDTVREIIPGYYIITSPRFGQNKDSLVFDIDTRGFLVTVSYRPDGFHKVMADGSAQPVVTTRQEFTEPSLYHAFNVEKNPSPESIYEFNESLVTDWRPGVYDIIPSFKDIQLLPDGKKVVNPEIVFDISEEYAVEGRPDYARIEIKDGKAKVSSASRRSAESAARVFKAKVLTDSAVELPEAVLVYDPDFEWRGMMIDIARNFQTPQTLERVLNTMADNGLNKLHFHAVDDEAWRLELPSLPELTDVGSRRGWGTDESDHLYQLFTGDGNPDNYSNTSNGKYTRDEFIQMLRMAQSLGIDVVPEIESPGHGRAALRAMEVRAKNGDPSYRLIADNDTSKFVSAQSLRDNVMNPALESTYKFMTTVFDDIIGIYKDAGVPLTGIHIGGDEIPRGAWSGSKVVSDFMKANGIADEKAMHAYFVKRLAKILSERGVPVYGWQEIALGHGDDYNEEIAPLVGGVNAWSTMVKSGVTPVPLQAVEGGYPVILSNANHLYFDLSYTEHPAEPGLRWGGHVNEFTAFDAYAENLCPTTGDEKGKILGVNAHLFGETMRSPGQLFMYLTPKIYGLAERSAHGGKTYSVAQFNTIVGEKELPEAERRFADWGYGVVHINQPGVKVSGGVILMNAPYEGGVIRYTLDGSEPDENSPVYTAPVPVSGAKEVRARYYRNGGQSVTTIKSL